MILLFIVGVASAFVVPPLRFSNDLDKILPLCSAAYSSNPQSCLTNRFNNAQVNRQVTVKCSAISTERCSGFTGVLHDEQAIVVAFRGTDEFLQLISESDTAVFKDKIDWVGGGKVAKYFYDAFTAVWAGGMQNDFAALLSNYPSYQVWVTGHSLGGAMASLCASFMLNSNMVTADQLQLYTLGQPRTGNKDWAAAHDQQFSSGTTYRLTHWRDMVAHLPPEDFEGYWHHGNEVWYKEDMKVGAEYEVCYDDESKKCSDWLTFTLSIDDHTHYFETDVGDWGDKGCN